MKAVIPAAGRGTRFLPATKATPKEMLPVLDRPAIQYVVEEALAARASEVIVVTSADKPSIAQHFAPAPELCKFLVEKDKPALAAAVAAAGALPVSFVEQREPRGLGHAVLCAAQAIGVRVGLSAVDVAGLATPADSATPAGSDDVASLAPAALAVDISVAPAGPAGLSDASPAVAAGAAPADPAIPAGPAADANLATPATPASATAIPAATPFAAASPAPAVEPFFVLLGDVLVPDNNLLPRMREISAARGGASVVAVFRVPRAQVSRFGVMGGTLVAGSEGDGSAVWKVDVLVEKPPVDEAPSNLAIFGRYLLAPKVMEILAHTRPGAGGEIQLTDAMVELLQSEEMYAIEVDASAGFDTGTIATWLESNIRLALRDSALAPVVRAAVATRRESQGSSFP